MSLENKFGKKNRMKTMKIRNFQAFKKRSLNKKGDIPITILVIGVFAICVLVIFSFITSSKETQRNFAGIGLIETMNSMKEEIGFDKQTPFEYNLNNVEIVFDNLDEEYQLKGKYTSKDGKVLVMVDSKINN